MPGYAFDPTGTRVLNRVSNELHTITAINGADHNYIIPTYAPFYDHTMVVVDCNTGAILTENVDYFFAYAFDLATEQTGFPISGAIAFTDTARSGTYRLQYNTLGGEYITSLSGILQTGLDTLHNLSSRKWETIVNIPPVFPPTPHTHRVDGIAGVSEILAQLTSLEGAIKSPERHISIHDMVDVKPLLLDPLQAGLTDLAVAIRELGFNKNLYAIERTTGTTETATPPLNSAIWTTIIDPIPVPFSGTYQISFGGNAYAIQSKKPAVFRYAINGMPVSKSTISGSLMGLSQNDTVSLQASQESGASDSILIAGPGLSCGITLIRVGE